MRRTSKPGDIQGGVPSIVCKTFQVPNLRRLVDRRRQQLKNDNFGEVARIGLYMRTPYSSHTGDAGSDWINQVSANSASL